MRKRDIKVGMKVRIVTKGEHRDMWYRKTGVVVAVLGKYALAPIDVKIPRHGVVMFDARDLEET